MSVRLEVTLHPSIVLHALAHTETGKTLGLEPCDCDEFEDENAERLVSVVHGCPEPPAATTTCCGKTPFELPRTDRLTLNESEVTCTLRQEESA